MSREPRVTAIVLAGGRSSRFGGDKLAVELDGMSILERTIRAVDAVADIVLVSGAPVPVMGPDAGARPPIGSIPDDEAFAGPLAALAGALREATTDVAIVVGGDMPGLVPAVLALMLTRLESAEDLDAVLLEGPGPAPPRRQVLPLVLRVSSTSSVAADAMREGDQSLIRLVDRLRFVEIPAAEWLALDSGGQTLFDVDRPSDLLRIRDKNR